LKGCKASDVEHGGLWSHTAAAHHRACSNLPR
jgi:hypothetical protein